MAKFGQRMVEKAESVVDHCAAMAVKAGCKDRTASRVACAAKLTTAYAVNLSCVLGGHLVDKCKNAAGLDDDVKGYGSDGEPEEVREHQHDIATEIYKYIRMSKAAYANDSLAAQFDFVKKSTLIHHVRRPSKFLGPLLSTDTEVHVCIMDEGTVAFVFRGTELHNLKAVLDWKSWMRDTATDLHMLPRSLKLYDAAKKPVYRSEPDMKAHKGFQLALRDVTRTEIRKDNLRMVLEDMGMKRQDVKSVVCTGHSLGGALATLCAKWCREVAFPDAHITCVTIGSPRVGNNVFANNFNTRVANESYRVVNKGDIVSSVPHYFCGYKHVRGGIYLAKHPSFQDSMVCTWGGARSNIRTLSIIDHRSKSYLDSFGKVLLHHHPHHH